MVLFERLKILIAIMTACAVIFTAREAFSETALVFDFETDKSFSEDWAAPALTDYTIRTLNAATTLKAMSRDRLNRLISRWPGVSKNNISFETQDAIRQHVGAKFIVEGRIDNSRTGFQFTGTLINPETGKISDLSFSLKNFNLSAAQKLLQENLKKAVGVKFVAKPTALMGTVSIEAYLNYWKGVRLYETGSAEKALPLFDRASDLDAGYIEPALMAGRVLLDKAHFSKAAEKFKQAAGKWPSDARTHFLLGLTYYLQRQSSQARPELLKATALDSFNPEYYYQLGLLDKEIFRYTDSLQELGKAVKLDPSLFDAWYLLASMRSYAKQESETLACLEKASAWGGSGVTAKIRNDNDFIWLHTNRRFQVITNK